MADDKVNVSDESAKIGLVIANFINGGNNGSNGKLENDNRRKTKKNQRKNRKLEKVPGKSGNTVSQWE